MNRLIEFHSLTPSGDGTLFITENVNVNQLRRKFGWMHKVVFQQGNSLSDTFVTKKQNVPCLFIH